MFEDRLDAGRYIGERYRSRDRKEWRHDDWQRDVRDKVMRKHGLLGATLVTDEGEIVPMSWVWDALTDAQAVHGSTSPKVTALRSLGLDSGDYCSTSPGRRGVRITPVTAEGLEAAS